MNSEKQLSDLGFTPGTVHWNLSAAELLETAASRGEGTLTETGALACYTGKHTGRSPKDKFIVQDDSTATNVDWGKVNQPISPAHFEALKRDQQAYLNGRELFVRDAIAGADQSVQLTVRCVNEDAWSNLFCRQLFRRPTEAQLTNFSPEFTILHTPGFKATPAKHGTLSETFIVTNFAQKLILIGGTKYAGEMKKSIFGVLNYLYPLQGIMPMHCSANVSTDGKEQTALFFGLSGTGKTTLSADPKRQLIGDDEHGWNENGIFNFEGGCYAKCINLSQEKEPQIWAAIRDGAILENVVVDKATGVPNYDDTSLTENTRAAYPLDYIEGSVPSGKGGHPKNIVFLTCDAFGVMPPVAKLTPAQAMYHFLSGYTAKVAGTEQGMGNTPQTTFSACFGAPFMPLKPTAYAELLGEKMSKHKANCWLINTGWSGGGVGVGKRMSLPYTRAIVDAALSGALDNVKFTPDPVFGLAIPESVPGVPAEVLQPRNVWADKAAYDHTARDLAGRFVENFKKFVSHAPELEKAGPAAGAAA